MRLLVISNNPERASFRQRFGVYIDRLREAGVDCEVAKLPACLFKRWKLFRAAGQFDAVFLHKKRLNFFDAFRLRKYASKIIYDFDDAIMYDDKDPSKKSAKRLADFARTVKLADTVIAGNTYLAEHALKYNDNVKVLATALAVGDYKVDAQKRPDDGKIRLVWIGSKSTLMYLEGIREALEEIGRRFDNCQLRIICDEFFDLDNLDVDKRNWSIETQCADLCSSDIGLAPLPDDNFTRGKCGFKILQYMAAGLPVVASGVGVNSEFVRSGQTGFTAANPQEWIDSISKLIADKEMRTRMGNAARSEVESFDVKVIGDKLTDILQAGV